MKILFLSQGHTIEDQPDFNASFQEATSSIYGKVELRNIPYLGFVSQHGWDAFFREIIRVNDEFCPDVVFFQFFHSRDGLGIAQCCDSLKNAANRPLIFGSLGDLFYTGLKKLIARRCPCSLLAFVRYVDAFFTTSMGNIAEELVRSGCRNVIFLPHAFCPKHFPNWKLLTESEKSYDVVMVGSRGKWVSRYLYGSIVNYYNRSVVVNELCSRFSSRFAVFGGGWDGPSARGFLPFNDQLSMYASCRVAVDAPAPYRGTTYYASDRPFFILGSGTPLVHFYTPRFERILRPNKHAFYVQRLRDVANVCEKILALPEDVLQQRRNDVIEFVKNRHLIANRVDTIVSTAEALMQERDDKLSPQESLRHLRLWHFLPEVDLEEERKYAIANWKGLSR